MTNRHAAREQATVELSSTPPAATFEWRAFVRWAEQHGIPSHPGLAPVYGAGRDGLSGTITGEQILLRYLHLNHETRGWSTMYMRRLSGIIARAWKMAGHDEARTDRWKAYLAAVARRTASPSTLTSGFTRDEILRIAPAVLSSATPTPDQTFAGDILAIAIQHHIDRPFARLPLILDRLPTTDTSDDVHLQKVRRVATLQWTSALNRLSARRLPGKAAETRAAFDEWWANAPATQRDLVVRSCYDKHLARNTQDLAYLYAGLPAGSRFAEASRLRIGWLHALPDAVLVSVPANQHKGGLLAAHHGARPRPLEIVIPHADDHPPHCPACRLNDHLAIRRLAGAPDQARLYTSRGAPLTQPAATRIIRRLFNTVASPHETPPGTRPDTSRRISTRSVRVTTATLAYLTGLSLVEITELGGWRQLSTAQRYIRHHEPRASDELVLRTTTEAEAQQTN